MTNTNTNTNTDTAPRWLGPVLVLASAVLFSFSGVLTKAIDAGSWTILTWRGLFGGVGIAIYVWVRNRAPQRRTQLIGRQKIGLLLHEPRCIMRASLVRVRSSRLRRKKRTGGCCAQ